MPLHCHDVRPLKPCFRLSQYVWISDSLQNPGNIFDSWFTPRRLDIYLMRGHLSQL